MNSITMYSAHNVEKAVREFYYSLTARNEAHHWLTGFQLSLEAWDICWDLLLSNSPEVQFFGATTLQMKISKYWFELSADKVDNLRKKIFDYVINYANGPKIILARLCIVLSSFVVQTIAEKWKTAIDDIVYSFKPENFQQFSAETIIDILIQTLTVLPEEFHSIVLPNYNRGIVRNALQSGIPQVLAAVQNVLTYHGLPELRLKAIKCFSSWIQFGIPLPDCEPIIPSLMVATTDDNLFESALDCLTNVCCHPDVYKYSESLQKLIRLILHMEPLLSRYLNEKDFDKCYNIYSLFTSLGETHCNVLLENVLQDGQLREDALRLVGIISQCSACPGQFPNEENCSSLSFNFWYVLQDLICAAEPNNNAVYKNYFLPIYVNLIEILIAKSVLPIDEEGETWSSDDKEQFRCYRQDIGDTYMYCYNILREPLLLKLLRHVEYFTEQTKAGDVVALKMLEASLYAFESVAESVDEEENLHLPQLFSYLPEISQIDVKVANATLNCIGAYAGWIKYHQNVLSYVMPVLSFGLKNSELMVSATRALKEISRDCQINMKPYANQLLTESKLLLSNVTVHSTEIIRLMSSVGRLLSTLEVEDIMAYLTEILMPYVHELERLSIERKTPTAQSRLLVILNMLVVLSANLDTKMLTEELEEEMQTTVQVSGRPQPLVLVLQRILPIIAKVAVTWNDDTVVIETICNFLKKSLSTLLDDSLPIMNDVLKLITISYQHKPRVVILDLIKQFLLLFGNDENHLSDLRSVLVIILNLTLQTLEKNLAENTELVQGFLQTLAQVIKKTTILQHPDFNLTPLFECGILALSLPENYTVKSATSFLVTFISQSVEMMQPNFNNSSISVQSMAMIVNNYGESLIEAVLKCIGGDAPRGVMDHIADILLALNKHYFDQLCRWMTNFLSRENFPSPRVTTAQKEHYTRLILKERVNKRKLQEVVKEYTLACRGLMGTEYGAQSAPFL